LRSIQLVGMEVELEAGLLAMKQRLPICFYGFTGNGKTLLAWEAAKKYVDSLDKEIPIVYMQLYPEMTKNSIIGGETLKDGTIVIAEQSILKFGKKGTVFIIDECTHTTEPVLLAFNSLIEEPYSTVVGDNIYTMHGDTRFIFCGNLPDHVGNIHLPVSFANRLFIILTGLTDNDKLVRIGEAVCKDAPIKILEFAAEVIRKCHEPAFPLSPRNIVTLARVLPSLFNTGFTGKASIPQASVKTACKEKNINEFLLRRAIMSSLMAHWVCKSTGPDKVEAMLWEDQE
jgi:hypothetical protein